MSLRVAELFAGVGGFRVGLQQAGHEVAWSNQWEPGRKAQHASDCYVRRFGPEGHSNDNIMEVHEDTIHDHDLLVGGFPCQDYSVATTLDRSGGLQGKKGVLWWEIDRILRAKKPDYVLLENVDRLLRSPANQRGRDFAIVLWCLQRMGYRVEWRVINAADYGFPQRRRRTFIFGARVDTDWGDWMATNCANQFYLEREGFFGREFPGLDRQATIDGEREKSGQLPRSVRDVSSYYSFYFQNAGVLNGQKFWTRKVLPCKESFAELGSVLQHDVDKSYYIPRSDLPRWRVLKGAKRVPRVSKKNGHKYIYSEGAIPFPDPIDLPSRTILTGEGGTAPNRSKHVIEDPETGKLRRLTPRECELLNGFHPDWTLEMPENWRYFTMGNALVVGLVARMGAVLDASPEQIRQKRSAELILPRHGPR